uniref:Uncharacterized protein n=1 Tax=Hemiselmis andersenii TaxID=464988 RepID=A0A6T8IUD7_HEMAN|mmetsp:Transcript_39340/g.91987  ORF Transcript_39340/g.91987 Transcript_39340/m.91987 type:complete len:282 (-) Transcript_39340:130-975(-)
MLRTAVVLSLCYLASALPAARPALPLAAKPSTNLGLRGGACPHLLSSTVALTGLQGGLCAFAPETAVKAYGVDGMGSQKDVALIEDAGYFTLIAALFSGALLYGLSVPKSMAVAQLGGIACLFRILTNHTKFMSLKKGPLTFWMVLNAVILYLGWNEGAGLIDGSDLAKYWAYFGLLNIIGPVFAFDKWSDAYGMGANTETQKEMLINTFVFQSLANSLMLLGSLDSVPKAVAGFWAGTSLALVRAVVTQQWRKFKQPNGLSNAIWLVISGALTYSAWMQA